MDEGRRRGGGDDPGGGGGGVAADCFCFAGKAPSMGGLEPGPSVGGPRAAVGTVGTVGTSVAALSSPKRRGIGAGDAASLCVSESE